MAKKEKPITISYNQAKSIFFIVTYISCMKRRLKKSDFELFLKNNFNEDELWFYYAYLDGKEEFNKRLREHRKT
jgi:hypothetical protein